MVKTNFFDDTFDKIAELGVSTTKKAAKAITQTFSPLKITEKMLGLDDELSVVNKQEIKKGGQNHSPLDFEKLNNQYARQDAQKQELLRNRLFQLMKQEDEKILQEKKQRKEQEKLTEERKKAEKKRQEQIAQQQTQETTIPRGKIRRSIFSPKKVAQKQHAEIKPAGSKN